MAVINYKAVRRSLKSLRSQVGSAMVGFIQAGTGAVSRDVQRKLREYSVSVTDYGVLGDGDTNNTTAIQAVNDYLVSRGGGTMFFPKADAAYLTNRIQLGSNVRILIDAGAEIDKVDTSTQSIFYIQDKDNVTIEGLPGAHIKPRGHQSSTIYIAGSRKVTIRGLKISGMNHNVGLTDGNDCIYVGGYLGDPSEDVLIEENELYDGARNCISVVECHGCTIQNNDIYGAGQVRNPGAGIDVEANGYDTIRRITISKNKLRSNLKYGLTVIFGDDVLIDDNDIYSNAIQGILTGAGGSQFNLIADGNSSNVARGDVDVLAISSYDLGTGEIEVSGCAALPLGAIVSFAARNAETLAAGLVAGTRYVVYDKNAANTKVRVALAASPQTPITSFADDGTGTLTAVYTTSDHIMRVLAEGQSSNIRITNNRLSGNCTDASAQVDEIQIGTSVNVTLQGNTYTPSVDNVGLKVFNSRNVKIIGETVNGSLSSTSTSSRGITISTCSNVIEERNTVRNFVTAGGFYVDGVYGQYLSRGTRLYNVGSASRDPYQLANVVGPVVRDLVARNDAVYTTANGFVAASTVTKGLFDGVDMTGLGGSNATSISVAASANRAVNCRQKDGTIYGAGSTTRGNVAATLTVGQSTATQVWNTALTADRAVTLSTTGAQNGDKFRIVRNASATGAFNLNVGTGPLKALGSASTWCEVEFDGSAWFLSAYGAL